ncbi:MAG: carboxypeptidase-like regulatory domain-containing protein [Pirellulaceae bacterium]
MIYAASARHCQFKTDESGYVTLPFFKPDDVVTFGVTTGDEMQQVEVVISDNQTQTIKVEKVAGNKRNDFVGSVSDSDGNAIKNAKVVVIHKSWPNGRFQMNSLVSETGTDGRFVFPEILTEDQKNEFLVTVFAEGFEMCSEYLTFEDVAKGKTVELKPKPAEKIRFSVLDSNGTPLPETSVVVYSRKVGDEEYMMYPASAYQCQLKPMSQARYHYHFLNRVTSLPSE